MSPKYDKHFNTVSTSQTEPIPGKNMVQNNADGYVFELDSWKRLERFLILGSDATYYTSEKQMTVENAQSAFNLLSVDGLRVVKTVVEITQSGRAPRKNPAIFVLAMASKHGDLPTRTAAFEAVSSRSVVKTGTDLTLFVEYRKSFGGWGRGMRKAVANWYQNMPVDTLAYQVTKYRNRNGWTHRDILRKSHPKTEDPVRNSVYAWLTNKPHGDLPKIIQGFEIAQTNPKNLPQIITDYGLTWEMVPTEALKTPEVWEALLVNTPMTALIRNLGRLASIGLISTNLGQWTNFVAEKISNEELIKTAKVHPIQILSALTTYEQGHGVKGSLSWKTVPKISDALNSAFYTSFKNIEPTGKNFLLGIDVSGSMAWGLCAGAPFAPNVGAAAMAMVTARSEKNYEVMGFSHEFRNLNISPNLSLNEVIKKTQCISFGGTDCALPMIYALKNKLEIDAFVVYTDNETWFGDRHPTQALREYREKMGRNAKLVVVGMTSTGFTIADPEDGNSLDCIGFDAAVPAVISDFIKE